MPSATAALSPKSRPEPEWLASLNPGQRAAALAGVGEPHQPPLLVIAGAGSGKTNTLAHRVAALLVDGADPGRILLLTFSRRAADEMQARVRRICARAATSNARLGGLALPWSGTFHSVAARLLREYAGRVGLEPSFTIHDREDSADLMNLVRHDSGLSARNKRFPLKGTCLSIYSSVVNRCIPLGEVLQADFPWCREWEAELKRLYLGYVEAKQAQQVLDYDDLLLYWARMLEEPELAREIGERFTHLLVDEYQDTNRLQATILLALKPDGHGLTVVGDDAQSIYAFRGATVRNILDFPGLFDPPAQRVTLDRNYRSTQPILAATNAVIAEGGEGYAKRLWSERKSSARPRLVTVRDDAEQAAYIVERTLSRREEGVCLKSQAVLFRAAHHSARLEIELTRRNIPFVKFGGLRFLEAAHIKDLLATLRWAHNPRDRVSGFRAIQLLAGLGPKTAAGVLENLGSAPPGAGLLAEQPVPAAARDEWRTFSALIESVGSSAAPWPASFEQICNWYLLQMERLYEDAMLREADVRQMAQMAATYPGVERFLTELTLDPPQASSGEAGIPLLDEDYLILSTIHSAKGQEWNAVTVLNVVDGCIPSDMATGCSAQIDEERRLLYVAMTRARDSLELMLPQRFYVTHQPGLGDRHVYAARSRFISNRSLAHFEQLSWPRPSAQAATNAKSREAAFDLAKKMRAMWH